MRKLSLLFIIALLFQAIHASSCLAVRPMYTEDCWVVGLHQAAIESGLLLLSERDNTGKREVVTSLKYGVTDNIDVSFDIPYISFGSYSQNYDGLDDGTIKIKYNPYLSKDKCEGFSFLLGYMVDIADANLKIGQDNNHNNFMVTLIYSKDIGEYTCHLNFGYTYDNNPYGTDTEDFIRYNASIMKPLNDKTNLMAENQYSKDTLTGAIVDEIAVGFNYAYSADLTFDAAIGCGLTEDSSSSNITFGLTYILIR